MRAQAVQTAFYPEHGFEYIAFDLAGSAAGYLLISLPDENANEEEDFFGATHYVEARDQLFGRYGGIGSLVIVSPREICVTLNFEVADCGSKIEIFSNEVFPAAMLERLRRTEFTTG